MIGFTFNISFSFTVATVQHPHTTVILILNYYLVNPEYSISNDQRCKFMTSCMIDKDAELSMFVLRM